MGPGASSNPRRELKQQVRDRLVAALKDYAATGRALPPRPPADILQRMMSAGVGQMVPEEFIPLLIEEMRFGEEDTRSVRWQQDPATLRIESFYALVIGAGLAGICAAARLKEKGIPFVVLEKNENAGGTWWESEYPDCVVDTPNHFFPTHSTPIQMGHAISPGATRSSAISCRQCGRWSNKVTRRSRYGPTCMTATTSSSSRNAATWFGRIPASPAGTRTVTIG
jgi:hypothetical protein